MTRHIKVRVLESDMGIWVKIIEQTHRGVNFNSPRSTFYARNGWSLTSITAPAYSKSEKVFYTRGSVENSDMNRVEFPNIETLGNILTAIEEYNEYWATKEVRQPETLQAKCYDVG